VGSGRRGGPGRLRRRHPGLADRYFCGGRRTSRVILLSWQAQEYEDNTGDGGAGGQCYLIAAHERGAGSMREQGAGSAPGVWQLGLCRA
jgi:hypothetical protein